MWVKGYLGAARHGPRARIEWRNVGQLKVIYSGKQPVRTSDPYADYATTSTFKSHSNVLHGRGWTQPTRHMHLSL